MLNVIKNSFGVTVQGVESTDVSSVVLAFMRYLYKNQFAKQMLMYKPLGTHIIEEIFKLIDSCMIEKRFSWKQCVDICTDGAQLMVVKK
jgi:hypothetical protein